MSRLSPSKLLEDEIDLLVRHFGHENVRAAIARLNPNGNRPHSGSHAPATEGVSTPTLRSVLDDLRAADPERYQLLRDFRAKMQCREVLPDTNDLRHFAQLIGLKELKGRARRDFVSRLISFLASLPREDLRVALAQSEEVSTAKRGQGFSVLTDKLLRET